MGALACHHSTASTLYSVARTRRARHAWFFYHYPRPLMALGTARNRRLGEADTHANFVPWTRMSRRPLPCPPPRRPPRSSRAPRAARLVLRPLPASTTGPGHCAKPRAGRGRHARELCTLDPRASARAPPLCRLRSTHHVACTRGARDAPGSLTITRVHAGPCALQKTAGQERLSRMRTLYLGLWAGARTLPKHRLHAARHVARARCAPRARFFDHYPLPLQALGTEQNRGPGEADTRTKFVPWFRVRAQSQRRHTPHFA